MKKAQHFVVDIQTVDGKNSPVYHPFTGELLVDPNPFKEMNLSMSDSLVLIYSSDYIQDGPFDVYEEFSKKNKWNQVEGIENEESLFQKLNEIDDEYAYIILTVGIYGNDPGDYGATTFVLRQKNVHIS